MPFLSKKILSLLFFCSILLAAAEKIRENTSAGFEVSGQKNEIKSEQKIIKDAESVAKHETQTWNEVNAAKKRQAAIEKKIRSDAEARRKAESIEWGEHAAGEKRARKATPPASQKINTVSLHESPVNHSKTKAGSAQSERETETTQLIKQNQAKTASAEKYLKTENAEKKKTEAEVARLIKQNKDKTAAAEKYLKADAKTRKKMAESQAAEKTKKKTSVGSKTPERKNTAQIKRERKNTVQIECKNTNKAQIDYERENKTLSEQKIKKDAENVAKHEAQTWSEVNAAKKRQAAIEAKIQSEAEARRKAERAKWGTLEGTKKTVQVGAVAAPRKINAAGQNHSQGNLSKTEAARQLERDRAKAAAEQKLKAKKAEADRKKAEAVRRAKAAAEQKRKAEKAEADRKKAEADRKKAEADRKKAEADRKKAEADRKKAEADRKKVEADRKKAEADRKKAEADRKKAEADRKKVEADRKKVEADRKKVEADRKKVEADRKKVEAEAARQLERKRAEEAAAEKKRQAEAEKDNINAKERNSRIKQALLWYVPNRLMDLADIFTIELGGGEVGIDLSLTRLFTFGAGVGQSFMFGWNSFRQYGSYYQLGWYADLLWYRAAYVSREPVSGSYKSLFNMMDWQSVDFKKMKEEKKEDLYAIGAKVSCYLNIKIQIHPIELADFIAGFFFIDFQDDDVKSDSSNEKGK